MGRLLQILGCALMFAAIGLAAGGSRADAEILAPIARAVQAAVQAATGTTGSASVAPSPTPIPTPKAKIERRGGPLMFSISGSLSLGETSTSTSFGQTGFFSPTPGPNATPTPGPFPFQQASTSAQTQSEVGAGFTADVSRRTATTSTDLKIPFGFSANGQSVAGVPQFLYSTPKYSLGYGAQQLLALGQLQLGTILRGFSLIVPQRYGQATFYEGPALGPDQETDKVLGVLDQQVRGRTLFESGFTYADGPLAGKFKMFEFGAATAARNLSLIAEGAWQSRSGGDGSPHGIAAQVRVDDLGNSGECSTTLRGVPDQFVTFSAGEIYSDRYADFTCHSARAPVFFDANYEKTGDAIFGVTEQHVETLTYSPTPKFGGLSYSFTRQDASSQGEDLWSNLGSVSLATQFLHTSALIGGQFQHSIDDGSTSNTESILASLRRPITHSLSVGLTGQIQKSTQLSVALPSPDASPTPFGVPTPSAGLQKGFSFDIAQQWKKTTVQIGETITRTTSATSDAIQRTPLVNVTRRISPVISITTSLGYQILHDQLNPASDGRSRVFAIALTAPFTYGNTSVAGRVDPRLPATISGRVTIAGSNATGSGANSNFATFGNSSGGVGNVLVTLDNKYVQRTDVSGAFQFAFISPGQHQVTIDNSSIPPGFTASNPVQTINVQGGQAATVSFMIGTFGGILGHVYGTDSNGNPIPLSNVQLRVDGGTYAQTDQSGAFGFGGLSAGQHVVTVIPQSIPASADFAPEDLTRKVSVSDGRYTSLDFRAQLLGSIAGTIIYAKDMDKQAGLGVLNAYVVAEPGEHAAIDEDDGSFIIDNLPAGDYAISVDPETIKESLGAAPDSVTVHLAPGEHYSGVQFLVGRFEKKVVFSLLSGGSTPAPVAPAIRLSETRLPPHGTTTVAISAPADAKDVAASAFGKRVELAYDKELEKWLGEVEVPQRTAAGQYPVAGSVAGTPISPAAMLTVDPKLPLVILQFLSHNNAVGQIATVRARFLVDVHAGDKITWEDGTQTVLGKPISGRVFTFQKQLTLLPLHGLLLTPKGAIPIELL